MQKSKDAKPRKPRTVNKDALHRILEAVDEWAAKNWRHITFADMAAKAGYSPFHFHRAYRLWKGEAPGRVLAKHQLERAKVLLLGGAKPATIVEECGYSSATHFSSRFKQMTGATPTLWLWEAKSADRKRLHNLEIV